MRKIIVICIAGLMIFTAGCSTAALSPSAAPTDAPTAAPATTLAATATTEPAASATPAEQTTEAPTATPEEILPLSLQDLQLVVEGEYYELNTDVGSLLEILGEEYDVEDVGSRVSDAPEKKFTYKDAIDIYTYEGDTDVMYSVEFTSDMFDTARSIHVGSTADEIKAAYGDGYYEENGAYVYTFNGKKAGSKSSSITFKLKDGVVSAVVLYDAGEIVE